METKHDVIIIGVPKDGNPTTIRRRYEEADHESDIHETLEAQVNYDTEQELGELDQMYYQTVVLNRQQAIKLKRQLEMALNHANDLKIFATES